MTDIKSKILQFGGKEKNQELLTTVQVRKKSTQRLREELKKRNLAVSFKDAFDFLLNHAFGGK